MKNVITIIMVLLISVNVQAYEMWTSSGGAQVHWEPGETTVHIDPSVNDIREDATEIVIDAFLQWSDHIEQDITLNFVVDYCEPRIENCVRYVLSDDDSECPEGALGCAFGAHGSESGVVDNRNIDFLPEITSDNLVHVALHEIGHFWGLHESRNPAAVMYYLNNGVTKLHADDIAGVKTIYSTDGTVYPSPEIEEIEYHFQGCSVSGTSTNITSLWSLIF